MHRPPHRRKRVGPSIDNVCTLSYTQFRSPFAVNCSPLCDNTRKFEPTTNQVQRFPTGRSAANLQLLLCCRPTPNGNCIASVSESNLGFGVGLGWHRRPGVAFVSLWRALATCFGYGTGCFGIRTRMLIVALVDTLAIPFRESLRHGPKCRRPRPISTYLAVLRRFARNCFWMTFVTRQLCVLRRLFGWLRLSGPTNTSSCHGRWDTWRVW